MKPWLKVLIGLAAAGTLAAGLAAAYVLHWQDAPLPVSERTVVALEPGESFARFASRLHQDRLIDHPRVWSWTARLGGSAHRVQAGEYAIETGDTPRTLLARLVRGEVVTYQVTFVEGWTIEQALAALAAHPVLAHRVGDAGAQTLLEVLGLPAGHAEGLFFPDTYQFVRGDSDVDILQRAYRRMSRVLEQAWDGRSEGLPYETPYQALIAASLIEKETGQEADRAHISQVFALRLRRGMRLQTDPAVIYGVENFDGDLKRVHLRAPGPYNTYLNRGLPPTPIALPGRNSIEAALHPADGDFLYFVSRGDGSSQFSESLEEHQRAVRRYQMPGLAP